MKVYEATSDIAAPPEAIWPVLVEGANYPNWDSGVDRVEGRIADGETIKVYSSVAPGRAFPVKVGDVEPNRRMRWSGGMPLRLFWGVRTFTLTPQANGSTRFHVREEYTGPLLPVMWRSMPDLGPSLSRFANGLKARVERGA